MALNTAALDTVYNYYLTTYAPKKSTSQFDTHKKSELRSLYNSIIKQNRNVPLCILDTSKESQEFAVGVKENARQLHNTIAALGGLDEDELLNKKAAFSSNEDIASANFIGDISEDEVPSFDIEVKNLASPQVNMGNFLPENEMGLSPNTYSFDIGINDLNYEFQFNINSDDTNKDVQNRLARLINNSNIGLEAKTVEDGEGNRSLKLSSSATGLQIGKESHFNVSDTKTSKTSGAVDYLGIREITSNAQNASFLINGEERNAFSNTFSVEKMYEVTLNGISSEEGDSATIGLKPDVESLTENISHLVNGYNDFLKSASAYLDIQPKSGRLVDEMSSISSYYRSSLQSAGLEVQDDGTIELNSSLLHQTASCDDAKDMLSSIKNFTHSVLRKSNQVSMDPMNYVKKTVVAYKDPSKNYASPYITSAYTGMMFNSYC